MTFIDLASSRRSVEPQRRGVPFDIPREPPYNAPIWMPTPTPDGTGSTVHPAVVDFGSGKKWHGYRYWMAITPYWQGEDELENPSILVSNDAWNWKVPEGLTNPIYPSPLGRRFNSDPDLEYDPLSDELVMVYRGQLWDGTQQSWYARSPDGVSWPHKPTPLNWTLPSGGIDQQAISPALIRLGPNSWIIFAIEKNTWRLLRWTATSPEAAWSGPFVCSPIPPNRPWHIDVTRYNGRFYSIIYNSVGDGLTPGTSVDGINWTWTEDRFLVPQADWETHLYRGTMTPHEDGEHFRVWYSAEGKDSWRTSYTEIPISLWPLP